MLTNRQCLFYENPKFVQRVNPFIQKLTENVKTKETTSWFVKKGQGSLQEFSHKRAFHHRA